MNNKTLDIISLFVKSKSPNQHGRDTVGNKGILQVTFVEALDQLMPGFDPEISKLAQRVLINPRNIDYHTGVFASKVTTGTSSQFFLGRYFKLSYMLSVQITPARDGKPVMIELIDAKTKEKKDTLEVP